jgi:hypothetical protein
VGCLVLRLIVVGQRQTADIVPLRESAPLWERVPAGSGVS